MFFTIINTNKYLYKTILSLIKISKKKENTEIQEFTKTKKNKNLLIKLNKKLNTAP